MVDPRGWCCQDKGFAVDGRALDVARIREGLPAETQDQDVKFMPIIKPSKEKLVCCVGLSTFAQRLR